MLILEENGFRMVQTGPRSYYTEHFEHQRWWRRDETVLLDTWTGTAEEFMREEFEAIVHPRRLTVEELGELFQAEFGEKYPPPISSKEELLALWPGLGL